MAKVRALRACWYEHLYRTPGDAQGRDVFEYFGPKQDYLQLLDGEWEDKPQPAQPVRRIEDVEDENKRLRAELAAARAGGGKPAKPAKPAKTVAVHNGKVKAEIGESQPVADELPVPDDPLAAANAPVDDAPPPKRKRSKKAAEPAPA